MILAAVFWLALFGGERASLQRYCDHEARALGLTGWKITVVPQSIGEIGYPTYLGHVAWSGKTATIRVLRRRAYRETDCRWRSDQRDTIRHELVHVLYQTADEETFVERIAARLK